MIKFFRSIRQRLLSENKFSKYLIYATGEIILVVIGILIALSVNNWNEGKKDLSRCITLLENLVEEIKQDSIYFNHVYHTEKTLFLYSSELLFQAHANPDTVIENDSIMGMAFRFACFTPVIHFSDNAYKELIMSDLLSLLDSNTLKGNLHEYYAQIKFLNMYSEQNQQISNDLISQLANYYSVIPSQHKESRMISNFSGAAEASFSTTYNLAAFRADKSLNPKLYDMMDIHKDRLGGMEIIQNLGSTIRDQIADIKATH